MLKFTGSWRSYQKRILDALEFHLTDKKLHVVAAPGAGKTTLGIEVISRLKQSALILCPTNTIKNQWRERICSAFLKPEDYNCVSTDIRHPAYLTITTYQALLAAFCEGAKVNKTIKDDVLDEDLSYEKEEERASDSIISSRRFNPDKADEIINILKKAKVSLLCFDEAHHLRKEWWKALTYLVEELAPYQTVALTATPPYDVDYSEWERYEELCGPIDEIISIPELVQNGDLCPHQDFIHFSLLRESENEMLQKHNSHVAEFLGRILNDRELFNYLSHMSFLHPRECDVENIFENPEMYVAIASLLKSGGIEISEQFLRLFNAKVSEIPNFNLNQAKSFLNGFLVTNTKDFPGLENKIEEYYNMAKRLGLVQNNKIMLNESAKIQKQIANSLGKMDSIVEIVELENFNLGSSLRMVILADYIKENDKDNSQLGVIPIWRTLKEKFANKISLGVLCGSLIIIPANLMSKLTEILKVNNISDNSLAVMPFKEDDNFMKITPKESAKQHIVSLVTEMFNSGNMTVLIGTQALLGEGWDAPAINSLILSSTVSSYMLSNQMRGRAIRVDKNNPDKISNIWHLASVNVASISDYSGNAILQKTISDGNISYADDSGFYDVEQLKRRFEGFEAPSYYNNHEIMNGISRVLPDNFVKNIYANGEMAFSEFNRQTMQLAKNRLQTKKWWDDAFHLGYNASNMNLNSGVDTPKMTAKTLVYQGYKQAMLGIMFSFLAVLVYLLMNGFIFKEILFLWILALIVAEGNIFAKFLRTGSVASIMKQLAIVHLETLSYLNLIKTSLKNVGINVQETDNVYVTCKNLQTEENNLLIKCLQEFLDPVNNPRYLLVKRNRLLGLFNQEDYFAVPAIISTRKKYVEIFEKLWNKYIGDCEIVYTRNLKGRKLLLKARNSAFSSIKREKSKKLSKWQ